MDQKGPFKYNTNKFNDMTQDEADRHEETAFDYLLKRYHWNIITTPQYALIDGVAYIGREITHIIEFKSRNESWDTMMHYGTYLISWDKIQNGMTMAKMMRVPFILIVYLVDSQMVLGTEIATEDGDLAIPDIEVKETRTQRSIEGGSVIRKNAYIDLIHFYRL